VFDPHEHRVHDHCPFEDDEDCVSSSDAPEYAPTLGRPGRAETHRQAASAYGIVVVPDLRDREFAERQGDIDLDEG